MTNLSLLAREALDRIADDYEASHTITTEIAAALDRKISELEVREALLSLADQGLAQAFVYDQGVQQFAAVAPAAALPKQELWFRCTPLGRAEII